MSNTNIFDETHVECNDCQAYWLDQCDGVKTGSQKPCTAFVATRRTNIPEQLKNLEKRLVRAETRLFWTKVWLILLVGIEIIETVVK